MKSVIIFAKTLLVFGTVLLPTDTNSARILNLAFFSSKSHKITYEPLLQELAARGHEVTVLAPVGFGHKKIREIHTFDAMEFFDSQLNLFDAKEKGTSLDPRGVWDVVHKACNTTYDLPHVRALLKEKFDLIIFQSIWNECALGFAYQFNAPLVIVAPAVIAAWPTRLFGSPSPPSFCANGMTTFSDNMTFVQRAKNLFADMFIHAVMDFYIEPMMESLYREKLNDPTLPSIDKIMNERASLMLSNTHFSLGQPRPFLPDIIEVGGMHCRPAKPLPKDLEDFVNSSGDDGFILFSMGSALKGSMMPDKYRKLFIRAFSKLKQKVLWKWETETMEDLPPNVKLSKWVPQQDVLGHPKAKAFITHGGFGSTTEAVCHGVPLIGIPMFGDQSLNMAKAETAGFALTLEFTELTEEILLNTINRVLNEKSFNERVETLAKVFADQPDKPLDRAVFWTEYVLRHKGAPHLRSPARDLNFLQYHSLDVIGVFVAVLILFLYLVKKVIGFVFQLAKQLLFGTSKHKVTSQKKKN